MCLGQVELGNAGDKRVVLVLVLLVVLVLVLVLVLVEGGGESRGVLHMVVVEGKVAEGELLHLLRLSGKTAHQTVQQGLVDTMRVERCGHAGHVCVMMAAGSGRCVAWRGVALRGASLCRNLRRLSVRGTCLLASGVGAVLADGWGWEGV